jgi:vacuolar-type H+-ATPase subunit D/Vma8
LSEFQKTNDSLWDQVQATNQEVNALRQNLSSNTDQTVESIISSGNDQAIQSAISHLRSRLQFADVYVESSKKEAHRLKQELDYTNQILAQTRQDLLAVS